MQLDHTVTVEEAVQLLAMVGDLSMGQPTDGSIRSARLAERLALADGAEEGACAHARLVTLLRWSGCTANASGFSALLGDDVGGRDAMLTHTLPPGTRMSFTSVAPLARIHCEVSGAIAEAVGLPPEVETGLRRVWEHHDGGGMPERLAAPHIPRLVYYVNLGSDLEILARAHGIDEALRLIAARSDKKYPAALVRLLAVHAREWLDANDAPPCPAPVPALAARVPLSIVADMIELKLPWLLGYSRRVADLAERAALMAGLPPAQQHCLGRAALLHGIGRAAVPNAIWQHSGKLGAADWEKLRLVPYWTARAGVQVPSLRAEAALASHVYERLDGSGYYRDLDADTLTMPQRILAAAAAYAALRMPRPWRPAFTAPEAAAVLAAEAAAGRFDLQAVNAALGAADGTRLDAGDTAAKRKSLLSERETAVLRRLSLGESNKEVARELKISPSTVRTHVESIFRKLGCSTRTAATLKGLTLGFI
ncbi:HD domain-containing phosphohydrolase [Telluria aromaticivorans]|uniref:Phosphohydrolase n=1 Tax=Telluria aromaticivorans TaxID=2725995 RepID=A0A7Y2P195_9BURK|nr:HD domain-containing phosphohydrolase [Telluria aromaticivorans]NNG23639.1 phosphohydrolase [Telluria aromaticivorans]